MKTLLTIKYNLYVYNDKYKRIGDEKTWKVYIKK